MKYCPECATAVTPGDDFCPICGTKLARFRIGEKACDSCGSLLVKIGKHIRCPRCDSYCADCGTPLTKKHKVCPGCKVSFQKNPKKRSLAKYMKEGHPLYKSSSYVEYAPFFIRVLALGADIIILGAVGAVIGVILGVRLDFILFWSFVALLLIIYNSLLIGLDGSTLGMKLYSIKVVNTDGHVVGILKGGLRFALALASIATLFGVGMIAAHKYKQGLHDMLFKTFVIRVKD